MGGLGSGWPGLSESAGVSFVGLAFLRARARSDFYPNLYPDFYPQDGVATMLCCLCSLFLYACTFI